MIFVLLTALFLLTVFILIYLSAERYTSEEFYLRLKKRVSISAQAYLEEDELSTAIYEDIRKKHLQTLPNEEEQIYTVDRAENSLMPSEIEPLTSAFFDEVFEKGNASIQIGNKYYTGLFYPDNQGDFVIVLSAEDLYGKGKMNNLARTLISAFVLSLVLLYVLGQYYAKQVLKPITDMTKKVNLIRAKNLHLRLKTTNTKDELGELAQTFNNMLDRLETSFEMQSSFIHNASHELKNPLTAIIGQTEVALNNPRKKDEYIETLKTVETEALRLDNLVNSLLDLAHIDHDAQGLIIEPIKAKELLTEIMDGLEGKSLNRINFNFDFPPENPDKLIFQGNHALIKVALLNILDNALKYSKNESIDIVLKALENTIHISISDKGIGIPKNDLKNIFEPFYRGSNARSYKGFGFGLPLSHKIIHLHGGELNISSQIGSGTRVTLLLPNQCQGFKIAR